MYCTWEWNTSILARIFLNAVNLLLLSKSVKKFNAIKQNKYTFFYYHYMSKIFCIITLGSVQIWYHTFFWGFPSHTFFPFRCLQFSHFYQLLEPPPTFFRCDIIFECTLIWTQLDKAGGRTDLSHDSVLCLCFLCICLSVAHLLISFWFEGSLGLKNETHFSCSAKFWFMSCQFSGVSSFLL